MDSNGASRQDQVCRLYDDGLSERAVAARLGLSKTRVHALLVRAGVERRPVGRPRTVRQEPDGS